ncbi:hypothetical protein ABIA94_008562 [Bradyrhizobium sp. LA7.1]
MSWILQPFDPRGRTQGWAGGLPKAPSISVIDGGKGREPAVRENDGLRSADVGSSRLSISESLLARIALRWVFQMGFPMFDTVTTALSRAILDEICEGVSGYEMGAKAHVASAILEAVAKGATSPDSLKSIGRRVLSETHPCGGSGR